MRKIAILLAVLCLLPALAYASDSRCPKTGMAESCLTCHLPDMRVRDVPADAIYAYPNEQTRVVGRVAWYRLSEMDSSPVAAFFDYARAHGITSTVIVINSAGGALFEGQAIVNMIEAWRANGGRCETRVYGYAFSAGFYVFLAGEPRLAWPTADLMWHEVQVGGGGFGKVETPSDRDELSRVLRHLQDVRNAYVASRGRMTKAEVDARVYKREWWMTGCQAHELGFATGLLDR